MPKTRKVGTGITRHVRIYYDVFDQTDRQAWLDDHTNYISPRNFPAWLDQYETHLAEMAKRRKLPTSAIAKIIYDKANRGDWYYASDEEWMRIACDPEYRRQHRFAAPQASHAWHYLTAEAAEGWQWGYQSVRWYLGKLMHLANQCRRALEREAWLELAGRCYELGRMEREFTLKFSGDKRLQAFERHVSAADKGNRTKKARADAWKAEVRRIVATHPDIDLDNAAAAARAVRAAWPENLRKPSESTLRRYISGLAKRAVLPEMESGT